MIEKIIQDLSLEEQQLGQHIFTIYLSKASAILTEFLGQKEGYNQQKEFARIAEALFRIKEEIINELERKKTLDKLQASIGTKETSQKNESISVIVSYLSNGTKAQRIVTEKHVSLITPSIIPHLFILQTQRANGSATQKLQSYYLIGEKNLPKEYQFPLDFEKK